MIDDGKSYTQEGDYNPKRERLPRTLCALVAIPMATIAILVTIISIVTLFVPALLIPLP